jgi:hypothetical protein
MLIIGVPAARGDGAVARPEGERRGQAKMLIIGVLAARGAGGGGGAGR